MATIKKVAEALELISGAGVKFTSMKHHSAMVDAIATALAENGEEIARLIGHNAILDADGSAARNAAAKNLARAESAEARLAEALKALEPFAEIAERDVYHAARRAITK